MVKFPKINQFRVIVKKIKITAQACYKITALAYYKITALGCYKITALACYKMCVIFINLIPQKNFKNYVQNDIYNYN